MPYGAGLVAAKQAGAAVLVDPRPWAVRTIVETYAAYPAIGNVLPAMGYSDHQLRDLEETIDATACDVVVTGTPIDLGRLITTRHPIRHARYELREIGSPTLRDAIDPIVLKARRPALSA
jgi:predicted GTPase